MIKRSLFSSSTEISAVVPSSCSLSFADSIKLCTAYRGMKIIQSNWFANEAVPHARRVSWSPQTTTKKQGAFVRLSRSNFYDPTPIPFSYEPYSELQIEAHRASLQQDVYIYKYNVSPTHLSLRTLPGTKRQH
jgi:hypothetical protein